MTFQRPVIMLDNHELADEADAAWEALVAWASTFDPEPPIVARGPMLVRVTQEGSLVELSETSLRDMLSRAARFGITTQNQPFVPKHPPMDHVRVLLERDATDTDFHAHFPQVTSITDVPIVSVDGDVIQDPGLHSSGVWYQPADGLEAIEDYMGDFNNIDDVMSARDVILDDMLGDFDFVDRASRANALGLVLLPFVREFIGNAPTPIHAVIAPQPGAGKSTLIETCFIPGLGGAEVSTEPRDEEEFRKKVTSELIAGSRAVFFDNLSKKFDSSTLAAALTSTQWKDRILGKSIIVSVPNRLIWAATGNNIITSNELRDRVCPIWLESPTGVPARRRPASAFAHGDIKKWTIENRARIVGACMTLVLHWLGGAASSLNPDGSFIREDDRHVGPTMGSFNMWAQTIGGILAAANVDGFLMNQDKLDSVDLDDQEAAVFIRKLWEWSNGSEFTTRDLVPHCQFGAPLNDFVPNTVGYLDKNPGHRMGRWLASQRDASLDGLRLRARHIKGGLTTWRVEQI